MEPLVLKDPLEILVPLVLQETLVPQEQQAQLDPLAPQVHKDRLEHPD